MGKSFLDGGRLVGLAAAECVTTEEIFLRTGKKLCVLVSGVATNLLFP
jgi:hypothetical protein